MVLRAWVISGLLLGMAFLARGAENPFLAPPELKDFAFQVSANHQSNQAKLQAILTSIFRPVEEGGLGVAYDNARTRTVPEVWWERKANCLSMTAFYVAACRSIGIDAKYAEALNTNRWRKVGNVVRFERHVVALTRVPPLDDLVADFLPTLRRRTGIYVVALLDEPRFRSLYYSNRAVELLGEGKLEAAMEEARISLEADAKGSVGWNIQGVVQAASGDVAAAEKSYRMALSLDARDGSAMGNLEGLLRNSGRLEEAMKLRALSEEVRKKDPYYNAYLGEEALNEGNLVEALRRIQVALKILPHEPEFFLLQARIRLSQGKIDDAVKDIQEAKKWADPVNRERYDNKLAIIQGEAERTKADRKK